MSHTAIQEYSKQASDQTWFFKETGGGGFWKKKVKFQESGLINNF